MDRVLKDPEVSDQVLYNRAKVRCLSLARRTNGSCSLFAIQGLLLIGAIFKQTQPDESDEERRELERCVSSPSAIFIG